MKLHQIAHSRTGDKGNTSNISLFVYDAKDYEKVKAEVTPERVKAYFSEIVTGEVVRYELPHMHGFNFVLRGALGGGVTRSLALDAHGKSLGFALLNMEV